MSKTVRRGYDPDDGKQFGEKAMPVLRRAGADLHYLLSRGYQTKAASVFVANHYLLSERQRLALARAISSRECITNRMRKQVTQLPPGCTVHIDGFNLIITLEVALSGCLLLKNMDGTIRDLAALRGTYRLIDKTETAIRLIGNALSEKKIGKAVFYLDAPVSNCGRLKQSILQLLEAYPFAVEAEIIEQVDAMLKTKEHVITGDAIILDECVSWINLTPEIIAAIDVDYPYVDLCISETE